MNGRTLFTISLAYCTSTCQKTQSGHQISNFSRLGSLTLWSQKETIHTYVNISLIKISEIIRTIKRGINTLYGSRTNIVPRPARIYCSLFVSQILFKKQNLLNSKNFTVPGRLQKFRSGVRFDRHIEFPRQ